MQNFWSSQVLALFGIFKKKNSGRMPDIVPGWYLAGLALLGTRSSQHTVWYLLSLAQVK